MKILSIIENPKYSKLINIISTIFPFVRYFIEKKIYKEFWLNDILNNFFTNNDVVDFLNKNEFALIEGEIKPKEIVFLHKKDVIETNEFYANKNFDLINAGVRKEFISVFVEIIQKEFNTDYENYVNLDTNVFIDEKSGLKCYEVIFRFYRENLLIKWYRKTKISLYFLCSLIILVTILKLLIF